MSAPTHRREPAMKKTVLLCDWCPRGNQFAVGSVELRLQGKRLALDLCKPHQKTLLKRLVRSRLGRPSKDATARRRQTAKARAVRAAQWAAQRPLRDDRLRDALLAILARNRTGWLSRGDFKAELGAHV